jgi:hypothetical protein
MSSGACQSAARYAFALSGRSGHAFFSGFITAT